MNLQTAKLISAPVTGRWSQVYLDDNLLVVIKIEKETDPSLEAKEIISRFHKDYASAEEEVLKKLEVSLGKISEKNVEIVVGVIFKDALYLGILNQGRAVLLREGNLVTLLEGKGGVTTASGFLQENDVFVLGTKRFFELVAKETLKVSLENKELGEAIETLAPIIHSSKEDGGAAGVIGKIGLGKKGKLTAFKAKAEKIFSKLTSRPRPIYLPRRQQAKTKEQRMMMTIAYVLVGLLFVSTVFGWQKKRKEKEVKRFNQFWEEIEYKHVEGKKLIDLNPLLARQMLEESLKLARERKEDFAPKNWQYKNLERAEKEVEAELERILREYELSEIPVFLDLNLVKKDLRGIDLDFWQNKMVVLGEDGTVVTIDLNKKTETKGLVAGGKLVTLWGERAFVFGGIEKEWSPTLQSFSDEAEEVAGFEAFAGNLYLLDKGENRIWKYPAIETGFGDKRNWLGSGVEPDFTEATSMAIDGDIWILLGNGKILKFSHGAPQTFGVSGLDQEWNHPQAFYTDEECQKIYVLDKGNKRVVVLHKSGEYDSQYLWEGIENVSDIVVNEEKKKILLLGGGKIFEVEIK